jgi:hypothetical protein
MNYAKTGNHNKPTVFDRSSKWSMGKVSGWLCDKIQQAEHKLKAKCS